jgi:hypothetical protein
MAELTGRLEILIAAVFRLVIQVRHCQHYDHSGIWMPLAVPCGAAFAVQRRHLAAVVRAIEPDAIADRWPVLRIPRFIFLQNRHGICTSKDEVGPRVLHIADIFSAR